MTDPMPPGIRVVLDPAVRMLTQRVWSSGSSARVIRLTPAGYHVWQRLRSEPVSGRLTGALARRLTDAGLAHPCPELRRTTDITVIVPVHNRSTQLARCLHALGDRYPIVVVDDGSDDPEAISAVIRRTGTVRSENVALMAAGQRSASEHPRVVLLRHEYNRGPAAARNTALGSVRTDLVAFVDSDCVPSPDWIERLAGHFDDPAVAAVAPRIAALRTGGRVRRCGLDLGERPARVAPLSPVSFVPTAALLTRRRAVTDIACGADAFDPELRVGEDVDLVWRLHEAGWRVRYDPSVVVEHEEPRRLNSLLARRFRYGTSAAPLARRHPGSVPPAILAPWPALTVVAVLFGQTRLATAGLVATALNSVVQSRRNGVPATFAIRHAAVTLGRTGLHMARYATQFGGPLLLGLALRPGTARRVRISAAVLLLAPGFADYARGHTGPPLRTIAATVAEDIAYGGGVLAGCLRHRTAEPIVPQLVRSGRRSSTNLPAADLP